MVDDLKDFTRAQRKIIEKSKSLLDQGPEDLGDEREDILGALARQQAKLAKFLQEKLSDFSKLPQQDFADGSLAEEFNSVYQEVKLAAKSLYEKKVELAVPYEQAGLEKAQELVHNLEKWLPDTPDYQKWVMEEPQTPQDIPLAELPAELEDIVGELLDEQEQMSDEIEDVSSSWMDSLDKGAGWDAKDGPISNMSAKGVTGNLLPNQHEIGGRSGEGRHGRSHGQMVEKSAKGKGGRETPTRLSPSPFETGSVEDSSQEDTGATGGGKLSGFSEDGLQGPAPPALKQKMARLAHSQIRIRQKAKAMAVKLRRYAIPTGDLETAITYMKDLVQAARSGRGLKIRRSFARIVGALTDAKKNVGRVGLRRERLELPARWRREIMTGLKEGAPRGYEEIVGEYFRALAKMNE